ncbi:hypothetical protein C5610_03085 [Idiomarina sp. OT37-5b]|uniref:PulJ/GspJ family protein n=1 Tax=Idiomarina sp. OT37-5b TaxID=2100422 RepID=UPI000CF953A9|nr:prepilin-type N-terminal cleavage/methylation domain-containing protein [Idiomarina sp. OT37-5b]AVJ55379.1 hypothetical protein C5610_03085 [Idiomarina sp. OT37-5b]
MRSLKRNDGFSLLEVLVAAAIFALWLPSSLYALQTALATQLKVQQRAERVEAMMTLHADIAAQWREGSVSVEAMEIDWQLDVIDAHRAVLTLSADAYSLRFILTR